MSDRTPPPPRRRIAGESPTPAAAKKAVPKKGVPKKAPAAKKATPKQQVPAAKKVPAKKASVTPTPVAPAKKPEPATKRPTPQVARRTPRPDRSVVDEDARQATTSRVAIAVAAIMLVAGAVLGGLGFNHWRGNDFAQSRSTAVAAASSAAETIFSFRYDDLDQHTADSKALMTKKYGKEFDTIVPTLTDVAPQRKVTVTAVTRNAAALPCGDECSPNKASVLIFVDQDRRLADDDTSTVFGNRIVVEMVKADGEWLVSDIRAL